MEYFEPACEYHNLAPDATFTDWVLASIVSDSGHKTLTPESFTEVDNGEKSERSISEQEWVTLLDAEFGIQYRSDTAGYNFVKIFGTPGCRQCSRAYSRQYE